MFGQVFYTSRSMSEMSTNKQERKKMVDSCKTLFYHDDVTSFGILFFPFHTSTRKDRREVFIVLGKSVKDVESMYHNSLRTSTLRVYKYLVSHAMTNIDWGIFQLNHMYI